MTTLTMDKNQTSGSKFSFAYDGGQKPSTQTPQIQGIRPITQRQVDYYLDLCKQRHVAPLNYTKMNYDELQKVIAELRSFYPASEKQIQTIKDKVTNLQELGENIAMPTAEVFNKLTGGREGTASNLIGALIEMEKKYADQLPPSDAQLEFLVQMYLCPDIPFESFDISRRIIIDEEKGLWRKPSPDEFAEEIKKHMKKTEASKFIDDHRGTFHDWKQTRIRPQQLSYIQELQKRLISIKSTSVMEWAVDMNGQLVQVEKHVQDKTSEYDPTAFIPLEDVQLLMFSTEEASKYIDILKSEQNKRYSNQGTEPDQTFEGLRTVETEKQLKDKEFKELNNLMFKLEKVAGYEDSDLHDSVTSLLIEKYAPEDEAKVLVENKHKIKEFMDELIESGAIDVEGLIELCKDSTIAVKILMGK
jgi:hypothetical protein